jgi:MFS family permease
MSSTRNQYYASFCANLLALGYGLSTGWTSAAIPYLQSPENPLACQISDDDVSLIGSILTIGGLVGTLFFGYAANEIGRKKTIFMAAFPQIIGWILMYYADSALLLILFRFMAGVAAGGIFTVVPVFISEIAEDR